MADVPEARIKQYANMVAALAIEDSLEHWDDLRQYFPDADTHGEVVAECTAIARRLRRRGMSLPKRQDEQ